MKINDRHLSAFAVSATPIDKEGNLLQKNDVSKCWQGRYLVLKGNLLFYFEKKGDKEPIGVIIVEGCTVELVEEEKHFCFKVDFYGDNGRNYIFAAESQSALEQWMRALATAGFDYMKLKVAELKKELADMDDISRTFAEAVDLDRQLTTQNSVTPVPPPRPRHVPSPIPPPRQRHSSFYKHGTPPQQRHQRIQQIPVNLESMRPSSRISINFKEIHDTYGRPILLDYQEWKHEQRQHKTQLETVNNLISF